MALQGTAGPREMAGGAATPSVTQLNPHSLPRLLPAITSSTTPHLLLFPLLHLQAAQALNPIPALGLTGHERRSRRERTLFSSSKELNQNTGRKF